MRRWPFSTMPTARDPRECGFAPCASRLRALCQCAYAGGETLLPAMHRTALLAAMLVLLAIPAAHAAATQDIRVDVRETGCPEGRTYCFVLVSGSLAAATGDTVHLAFHNGGTMVHEILVVAARDADTSHKATGEGTKLAAIEDVPAGGWGNATFTMPAGGVYLWCGQPGHESLGMWLQSAEGVKESPAAFLLPLLALVVLGRRARREP